MNNYDWRKKDDRWQKRHFFMSSFVRMNVPLTSHVYEFIDYIISQGYQAPLDSLNNVDKDVRRLYNEYAEYNNWEERI